jgi:hypothetical protein
MITGSVTVCGPFGYHWPATSTCTITSRCCKREFQTGAERQTPSGEGQGIMSLDALLGNGDRAS